MTSHLYQFEMDFVYLDEIQDVNIAIIQDLDRLAKHGFVGFGDNAQNITKGVSMKFSNIVELLSKNDIMPERVSESKRSERRKLGIQFIIHTMQ